jgi:transposase-like protein
MEFVNQQYAVVNQVTGVSKNGGSMVTVNMRGVTDNKHYHTYVVKTYKNSRQWQTITERPGQGHIVYFSNGKFSAANQIDADSKPEILISAPTIDIHAVVDEVHGITPKKRKPTKAEILADFKQLEKKIIDLFD